jgi:hypothetical protein
MHENADKNGVVEPMTMPCPPQLFQEVGTDVALDIVMNAMSKEFTVLTTKA